jgi:hypothetical protein
MCSEQGRVPINITIDALFRFSTNTILLKADVPVDHYAVVFMGTLTDASGAAVGPGHMHIQGHGALRAASSPVSRFILE